MPSRRKTTRSRFSEDLGRIRVYEGRGSSQDSVRKLIDDKKQGCIELEDLLKDASEEVGDETFRHFCDVSMNGHMLLRDFRDRKEDRESFTFSTYVREVVKRSKQKRGGQ